MKQKLVIREFSGGFGTTSEKKDVVNSAKYLQGLNVFEDPSYITLAKQATKVSGDTVTDLVLWAEDGSPYCTDRFFYSNGGKIYKETSGLNWSSLRTVSGSNGEGLKVFDDYLYYALDAELGRYGKLSGTPTFNDSFLSDGTMDLDVDGGSTGQTYATETTIAETATKRQTFIPTHDPIKAVVIDINDTGDDPNWTVTIHDANNVEIGTATKLFATVATGDNTFTFATPLRVVIGNEYHIHVTTSTTTGAPKVTTGTASDMEDAEYRILFGVLISSEWHPMVVVEDVLIIGNNRYLATWDQATYEPNQVTLDPGFEVVSIAKFEEFIVAAAVKGGSISGAEEARLYFWDGLISGSVISYNFYTDVSIGAPNVVHNSKGQLIGVYGNQGAIYTGNDPFQNVVHKVPNLTKGKYAHVFAGAITEHEGRTLIGYSGLTDDGTGLYQGIYEYGKQQGLLPDVFNFPYIISTGSTQGTNLKIGMVKSMGTDLYIGWRDGADYGVDKIAITASACSQGTYRSLIFDAGDPNKEMLPISLTVTFEPFAADEYLTATYQLDRSGSWLGSGSATTGETKFELPIFKRCKEIEFGFDLYSDSGTFPKVTGVVLEYDDLREED